MSLELSSPLVSRPAPARRRISKRLLAAGVLLTAGFLAANCSNSDNDGQSTAAAPGAGKRSSDAGSVTVDLAWRGRETGLVFTVSMNTHSLDLDGFDLMKLAVLRTDQGIEVAPASWDAPKGGHHREGTLAFPATVDGRPILDGAARGITVILRDVASPERSFQWTW